MTEGFLYPGQCADALHARLGQLSRQTFGERLSVADQGGSEAAGVTVVPLPTAQILGELLDGAFFASLMDEEGRAVRCRLTFADPAAATAADWPLTTFLRAVPFSAPALRKLALASGPDSSLLGLFAGPDGAVTVWGIIHLGRYGSGWPAGIGIEITGRGALLVRFAGIPLFTYQRGLPINHNVEEELGDFPLARMITRVLGGPEAASDPVARFAVYALRVVAKLRRSGHGGTLLLVRTDCNLMGLKEDSGVVVRPGPLGPLNWALRRREEAETELLRQGPNAQVPELLRQAAARVALAESELGAAVAGVADLAAIDGAVILRTSLQVERFGAMIDLPAAQVQAAPMVVRRDPNNVQRQYPPEQLGGGTRHRSAHEFCFQNPGSVAFVVSQDGEVTIMLKEEQAAEVWVLRPFATEVGFLGW